MSYTYSFVFILSTSFFLMFQRRLLLKRSMSAEVLGDEYVKTLASLFRAVKNPSRHSVEAGGRGGGNESTVEHLFTLRKQFFQRIFKESFPSSSSSTTTKAVKIVHVAGSKGKGSVVEFISSAIDSGGHRVGVFTSPHLHTARERIKIGRKLISRSDLTRLGKEALCLMENISFVVFFDLFLTTALRYFGEQKVDYIVLEAGIGGRFDSTNFMGAETATTASVSVITSISLDHQALLGETVEEIAWQKAGIIKPNSHAFTPSTQPPTVLAVLRRQCADINATLHEVPVSG